MCICMQMDHSNSIYYPSVVNTDNIQTTNSVYLLGTVGISGPNIWRVSQQRAGILVEIINTLFASYDYVIRLVASGRLYCQSKQLFGACEVINDIKDKNPLLLQQNLSIN